MKKDKIKQIGIGIVAGIISGLFASGGGLILVPAYVYILKLTEQEARANAIFCILPMVTTTAILYANNHYIEWKVSILCAVGGMIGAIIGAKLLNKIKVKYLKLGFIIFLLYAGVNMILRSL